MNDVYYKFPETAKNTFVLGEHEVGKISEIKKHHEILKNEVKRAAYKVSVTYNENTRAHYDKSIEELKAFENEYKTLLDTNETQSTTNTL